MDKEGKGEIVKLKVLLVDDEPFILQGLTVLVDWEAEGFEIAGTASNGREALEYLKEQQVDLIIADIRMPVMTGLELLQTIRENEISDAYFIILSGYNDFRYAQKAIHYSCMDYILKPVQKELLVEILQRVLKEKEIVFKNEEDNRKMKRAYLAQNLIPLLRGKYEQSHLDYLKEALRLSEGVRYIHISFDNILMLEEMSDDELRSMRNRLFGNCLHFLGDDHDHCLKDVIGFEEDYEIGFLYCDYMAEERGMDTEAFLEELHKNAKTGGVQCAYCSSGREAGG